MTDPDGSVAVVPLPDGAIVHGEPPTRREVERRIDASDRLNDRADEIARKLERWGRLRHGWPLVELFRELVSDEEARFELEPEEQRIGGAARNQPDIRIELVRSTPTRFRLVATSTLDGQVSQLASVTSTLDEHTSGKTDWRDQPIKYYTVSIRIESSAELTGTVGGWLVREFFGEMGRFLDPERPAPLKLEP